MYYLYRIEQNKYDFLNAADVLFLSDEWPPCAPKQFLHTLSEIYPMNVIVLGCGAKGAVLYDRKKDVSEVFLLLQILLL